MSYVNIFVDFVYHIESLSPATFMFLSTVTSKTAQELSWTDAKSCPVAAKMPAIVLLTHWLTPYEPDLCAAIWRAWKALYNVDESTLNENEKHINDDNRTFATIVTHMWQNRHTGEQGTHWKKTNKGNYLVKWCELFVSPAQVHPLHSMVVLHHVND